MRILSHFRILFFIVMDRFSLLSKNFMQQYDPRLIYLSFLVIYQIKRIRSNYHIVPDVVLRKYLSDYRQTKNNLSTIITIVAVLNVFIMRHFNINVRDQQNIMCLGSIYGYLMDLATGQGKTIAILLLSCLNYNLGHKVHICTPNSYLAHRDYLYTLPFFKKLKMTSTHLERSDKRDTHFPIEMDVCYSTPRNYVFSFIDCVLRNEIPEMHQFVVILDEADHILIDTVKIPMIVAHELPYKHLQNMIASALITKESLIQTQRIDEGINIPGTKHHLLEQFIKDLLYCEDYINPNVDYIVEDGKIKLMDNLTDRLLKDHSYSSAIHQMIEAKEKLDPSSPKETHITMYINDYLKMYRYIQGCSGTMSQAKEFIMNKFGLNTLCIEIKSNKINKRHLLSRDMRSSREISKLLVSSCLSRGQPLMIVTDNLNESQNLHALATHWTKSTKLNLLNALTVEGRMDFEQSTIEKFGDIGSILIGSKLLSRGTNIRIGGRYHKNKYLINMLGGIYMISSAVTDDSRFNQQLSGRIARYTDPGEYRLVISKETPIIREVHQNYVNLGLDFLILSRIQQYNISIYSSLVTQIIEGNGNDGNPHHSKIDDYTYIKLVNQLTSDFLVRSTIKNVRLAIRKINNYLIHRSADNVNDLQMRTHYCTYISNIDVRILRSINNTNLLYFYLIYLSTLISFVLAYENGASESAYKAIIGQAGHYLIKQQIRINSSFSEMYLHELSISRNSQIINILINKEVRQINRNILDILCYLILCKMVRISFKG